MSAAFVFVFLIQFVGSLTQLNNKIPIANDRSTEHQKDIEEGVIEMVRIPAGIYQMGTDDVNIENDEEIPKRFVALGSFYLDKFEVSNQKFSHFVAATNYKTVAENNGDSSVFQIFLNSTFKETLKHTRSLMAPWWYRINGAYWRHPYGPDSNISNTMDHPVVHVSWRDAQKYCTWRGARLPTEAEWEGACRAGHHNITFPWGNELFPNNEIMANNWQGTFPTHNSERDGYVGSCPVSQFYPNEFGLYNMIANVWEWTDDNWSEDNPEEKVAKGGSYLCHHSYCYRYRCAARTRSSVESGAVNTGFRCAKTIDDIEL